MSAFDINSVQEVDVGGQSVIQMPKEQFATLLEEMEVMEDSLAVLRARADEEPRLSLDEYLKQRGARVRGDADESGNQRA